MKRPNHPIKIQSYETDCLFCGKYGKKPIYKINFAPLLNRALFTKYASTKKHLKKFEDFVLNKPLKWIIDFKDQLTWEEEDEYLKRYYSFEDQNEKFEQLLEYYKYHKDIPRMFMRNISDIAIFYFETRKQLEYRRIKMMLGIAIDDTQSTKYDPPKEDIRLLSQITQQTQVSSLSLLKELLKQQNQEDVKIDESWLTMTQGAQPPKTSSNMMVLKQLISKQSKSPPVSMKNLIKDVATKIQPKIANQNDFKKFIKQQILNLNHYNSAKPQVQKIQISNYHSKQNSCHFQTSTRSISSEQLKMSFPLQQQTKPQPSHKKSQTHYTEVNSPQKKIEGKIQKLHTNSNQLQQPKSPEKFFKIYTSPTQTPAQTNINININQLNMNNLNLKNPQQQYKALLESPTLIKKKLINSCTADSQRIAKHQKNGSLSSKVQIQQVYVPNINQIKTRSKQK
ncbi:hypothetical protein pb186bvf_020489 [Paramecium bursaria]